MENSRFLALVPEKGSKEETHEDCGEVSDAVVGGVFPVGAVLFPEARVELSNKAPGIFLVEEEIW